MFFADRDTDAFDDRNDVDKVVGKQDERLNTIEESQKPFLLEKGGKQNTLKGTKVEDQERVEEEQRELQFRELREKTFESVENAFVSRNNLSSQILLTPSKSFH